MKFRLIKWLALCSLFATFSLRSLAQVNVQATAGTTTGTYTTLNAAFAAINAGTHQGAININITGNTIEPATPVDLLKSASPSNYTQITIKPQGGNFTITGTTSTTTYKSVIQLLGADNVTIDGDDPNTPGQRNLTIIAPSSTTTGVGVIKIASNSSSGTDGAENITIKNLNIIGARSSATATNTNYGIVFANTTASSTGAYANRNVKIENNYICKVYYGIYANGASATYLNTGLEIKNNLIGSASADSIIGLYGIYTSYSSNVTTPALISGNDIRVGLPLTYTTTYSASLGGIQLAAGCGYSVVEKNYIHDIHQIATSGYGAYGIFISSATSNTDISIINNVIRDVVAAKYASSITSLYENYGIYVSVAATNLQIIHNTIVFNELNRNASVANYTSANVQITSSAATISKFYNNILVNKNASANSFNIILAGSLTSNPVLNAGMNNNSFYTPNNTPVYLVSSISSLNGWRATLNKDANSIDELPPFVSNTDLHIANGSNSFCESGGASTSITGVLVDFDNQTRPGSNLNGFGTAPDIGAYEFDGSKSYSCLTPPVPGATIASTQAGCIGASIELTTQNSLVGTGYSFQWQQSTDNITFTDIIGANDTILSVTVGNPLYYRMKVSCAAGITNGFSTPILIEPTLKILSSTAASRCGPGTLTLQATANANSDILWYTSASGGQPIGTGTSFTTPNIFNTTTFYAEPADGRSTLIVPSPTNPDYSFISSSAGWGLRFTANQSVSIDSITITAKGSSNTTATIQIKITDLNDQVVYTGMLHSFNITTSYAVYQIPVFVNVAPGNYKMVMTYTNINDIYSEDSGLTFPYNSTGNEISITAGANGLGTAQTTARYYWFFRWVISKGCAGPRVPVIATVNPAPAFSISDDATLCNNAIKQIDVTTGANNYNEITWQANNGLLFTDATATTAYVNNTNANTVYFKSNTYGIYEIIAIAKNATTDCQNIDTVHFINLPDTLAVLNLKSELCQSGTSELSINFVDTLGSAGIQWQSSTDNVIFNNINGANTNTFLTSNINITTYYRAVLNVNNQTCVSNYLSDTVIVNNPSIVSVRDIASCDSGIFTITPILDGNYKVNWYDAMNATTPIYTGNQFTTPMLTASTTYFLKPFSGGVDTLQVGQGTTVSTGNTHPFSKLYGGNRYQYVITAQELLDANITPGNLNSIAVNFKSISSTGTVLQQTMQDLTISIGKTTNTNMTGGFVSHDSLTEVYNQDFLPTATGWHYFEFDNGFFWDGSSNLIVEFISNSGNSGGGGYHHVEYFVYPYNVGYRQYRDGLLPATADGFLAGTATSTTNSAVTTHRPNFRFGVVSLCEGNVVPVNITIKNKVRAEVLPNGNVGLCDGSTRILNSRNVADGYKWLKNGVVIPNANNANLEVREVGEYRLVTIQNGCTDTSAVVNVALSPSPTVDLGSDFEICVGGFATLNTNTTGLAIQWDDNSTNITRNVTAAGTYYVRVTNNFGCTASDTIVVSNFPVPQPSLGNDTAICKNDMLVLQPGTFEEYLWNTGSNSHDIAVLDPGKYFVEVKDNNGCIAADTINITYAPSASVDGFAFVPYFYEALGKFKFNAINPRLVIEYFWDFGDGNTSTLEAPEHIYSQDGAYDVRLIVKGPACYPQEYTQQINVNKSGSNTGIEQYKISNVKLYPNPAKNQINIEFENGNIKDLYLEIFDVLGRKITLPITYTSNQLIVNTESLISGIYNIYYSYKTEKGNLKFEKVK
jgi:hypothetical protein